MNPPPGGTSGVDDPSETRHRAEYHPDPCGGRVDRLDHRGVSPIMGFLERWSSLGSYQPWERRRLLDFACLRVMLTVDGALGMLAWQGATIPWWAYGLGPCYGILAALISADWIEHGLKRLIFGYTYNPNVMARGELEGSNTIMVAEQESAWREKMFTHLAIGDDPGRGHYDYPDEESLWRR